LLVLEVAAHICTSFLSCFLDKAIMPGGGGAAATTHDRRSFLKESPRIHVLLLSLSWEFFLFWPLIALKPVSEDEDDDDKAPAALLQSCSLKPPAAAAATSSGSKQELKQAMAKTFTTPLWFLQKWRTYTSPIETISSSLHASAIYGGCLNRSAPGHDAKILV
jgi:hypothetical protein